MKASSKPEVPISENLAQNQTSQRQQVQVQGEVVEVVYK